MPVIRRTVCTSKTVKKNVNWICCLRSPFSQGLSCNIPFLCTLFNEIVKVTKRRKQKSIFFYSRFDILQSIDSYYSHSGASNSKTMGIWLAHTYLHIFHWTFLRFNMCTFLWLLHYRTPSHFLENVCSHRREKAKKKKTKYSLVGGWRKRSNKNLAWEFSQWQQWKIKFIAWTRSSKANSHFAYFRAIFFLCVSLPYVTGIIPLQITYLHLIRECNLWNEWWNKFNAKTHRNFSPTPIDILYVDWASMLRFFHRQVKLSNASKYWNECISA